MVKTGQALTFQFPSVGSTGALTNADSTPTCTMYVDGVADGGAVTVTNPATGRYKAVCTVPTLTAGQCFEVWAAFAVATVNGGGIVFRDMADTTYPSETYSRIGATGSGLTSLAPSATALSTAQWSNTRAGYLDNLSAGAVATAAKLLSYVQSMLRSDVTVDTDIGGTYDDATDSQQAIRDRGDAAWGSSGGISASDVWSYATRTLTQGAASVATAVTGSTVTVYRGTRWSISLTGLTTFNTSTYTSIIVSVKRSAEDADSAAIFQVRKNRTGSPADGLTYFENAPTITAGQAAITVDSATAITIVCEGATTQYAEPGTYQYAIKILDASGYPTMISAGGTFTIVGELPLLVS